MLTSAPSSSTRYFTDGIQPSGAWRCALPAKPSPYSTPAAACSGNAPGPPPGTGGPVKRSWFGSGVGGTGPPAPPGTNCSAAADPGPVAAGPPRPPRPPKAAPPAPGGTPRRIACCGAIVGMFGSAPYDASSRIASTSVAYAARQNGVEPELSARPQFRLPQPLY